MLKRLYNIVIGNKDIVIDFLDRYGWNDEHITLHSGFLCGSIRFFDRDGLCVSVEN